MSEVALSLPPGASFRDEVWGRLCILHHVCKLQDHHVGPTLSTSGALSSQCLLLPGPGLFHFLSVDHPVCVLCVTVGRGKRPALHHAARR